jgi:uncharacterized protein
VPAISSNSNTRRGAARRTPAASLSTMPSSGTFASGSGRRRGRRGSPHQHATGTVRAGEVTLSVRTDYPWDGRIEIGVDETSDEPWTLRLRVPAWARGARWVAADPRIDAVRGCAAVERGLAVAVREVGVEHGTEWPYGAPPAERAVRRTLTLIPYHAWANRGPSTMRVWMPV